MPVIHKDSPGFAIRPPCTINDDGAPSDSLTKDAERVFAFIEDERHLTAESLLTSIRQRVAEWDHQSMSREVESPPSPAKKQPKKKLFHQKKENEVAEAREKEGQKMEALKAFLESKNAVIEKLENRCRIFHRAQQNLNEDDDWTLASKHFGITTYYRREEDSSLSIKMEGEVKDAPLFEQLCVLKEVDLHYKWSPFCTSSMTVADLDKLDLVGWFLIGMPNFGLARDGCYRAIGCDNIQENGSILLAGQGVQDIMPGAPLPEDTFLSGDPIIEKLDIPPVPKRIGIGRMTIRKFEAMIHLNSPTSANTKIVANINPNISFLPNSLLEFVMKHLAGMLLFKLQGASKKAAQHPVTNEHARKMREEKEFYVTWLMAKFKGICDSRGWEMPPVAAFELSEHDLQRARKLKSHGPSRAQTFNVDSPDDQVVENLSVVSSSEHKRGRAGNTDTMSELSNNTGKLSIWSNNPVASYLREAELKTQQQKQAEIAAVRQRAAERLIPKDLPSDRQERLSELKKAKARRNGAIASTQQAVSEEPHESISISQRLSNQLYGHDPRTRFFVEISLVCILFMMLHPEPLLRYLPVEFDPQASWRVLLLQDIGVVMYILLCAVPHFLVCDVALVYAFDALELGSKTGQHVKKFYSDNVRLAVAVGSLGIVGASILKAALKVWIRCFLWSVSHVFRFLQTELFSRAWSVLVDLLQVVPEEVRGSCASSFSHVWTATNYVIAMITWTFGVPAKLIWRYLIQSNFVGRKIAYILGACLSVCIDVAQRASGFVEESIDAFEGKITLVSWRIEAFIGARTLFLYTAVFLLTALVLFHLSARKSRPASTKNVDTTIEPTQPSGIENVKSDTSLVSGDRSSRGALQVTDSEPIRYSAIPEENAVHDKIDSSRPFTADSESTSTRRRRRFRFRNKR